MTPFTIDIPRADLDDLAARLDRTRWTAPLPGTGWDRGIPAAALQELAHYWRRGYDWRAAEARLNAYPQFLSEIDGAAIHFVHARSPHPDAVPLVLTHGWPGSVFEFVDVIGQLTEPADPADAFHVVIPSVPGFGFSTLPDIGWTSKRVARAWAELMARLGYDRYGAQGGDLGAWVSPDLGRVVPDHVVGVHVNAATVGFIPFGPVDDPDSLTEVERGRLAKMEHFRTEEWGYNLLQSTRPATLAYALGDSPVGQLAWLGEKFHAWSGPKGVDRDHLLTNVSLYWFTRTAGTSANFYFESTHGGFEFPTPSGVPTGVAVFGEDVSIRRFAEQSNVVTHWSDFSEGGHFAALETPDLLVEDIRTFFRPLR
jgi:pimeloyl-ACP methyl ester carboxylesterase